MNALEYDSPVVPDLSPEELAELSRKLQAMIDQAQELQRHITERLSETRRNDQSHVTTPPHTHRRADDP
jgi:uncharacterized coiled-coil protein SlyX